MRKHVKNHDFKGRRKSHKESTGNKLIVRTKTRRTYSESTAATPSTPLTPRKFDFDSISIVDDVFEEDLKEGEVTTTTVTTVESMNFDEMSNCLITLMDHSTINGDNIASSLESIGNGYKQCDNNYDSINYVEQNELYFS